MNSVAKRTALLWLLAAGCGTDYKGDSNSAVGELGNWGWTTVAGTDCRGWFSLCDGADMAGSPGRACLKRDRSAARTFLPKDCPPPCSLERTFDGPGYRAGLGRYAAYRHLADGGQTTLTLDYQALLLTRFYGVQAPAYRESIAFSFLEPGDAGGGRETRWSLLSSQESGENNRADFFAESTRPPALDWVNKRYVVRITVSASCLGMTFAQYDGLAEEKNDDLAKPIFELENAYWEALQ